MMETPERLTMDDCFRLVGKFMYRFALVEGAINGALRRACAIDGAQGVIILANLEISRKLYILRSVVSSTSLSWEAASTTIKDAQQLLELRNIVAHTIFGPTQDAKVKFLTVKAKSKLQYPETVLSLDDFEAEFSRMRTLIDGFKDIESGVSPITTLNALAAFAQSARYFP